MKNIALSVSGIMIAIAVIGCVNSSTSMKTTSTPSAATTHSSAPKSVIDPSGYACATLTANGYCPLPVMSSAAAEAVTTPVAATPATTTALAMSTAEQQAVESAQSYLDLGSGFSEAGLFSQLTSSYGGGFTAADAQFAINYLKPDWNAQAVLSAKGYMAMGGFSRESLIQQLTSSYGAGFTEAQAEYAVSKVGL